MLYDDLVFLIMGIVKVTRMLATMRAHCWQNNGAGQTQGYDILRDHIVYVVSIIIKVLSYTHVLRP